MKNNIAIVGGSGFIGTRLTKRLLEEGHNVKIIDIVKSKTYPDLWIEGNVRNEKVLIYALQGCNVIYNLAAEHKDDIRPLSLYHEVNVKGAEAVCLAAEKTGIKRIIFTSTVAVYGFTEKETDESAELKPFNEYGYTKQQAEIVYKSWQSNSTDKSLVIIRPTVVFGEGSRGNVYNLLNQIIKNHFIMVGNGKNIKSMVYVENIAALLKYALVFGPGYYLFNAVDKPDFNMNSLVSLIKKEIGGKRNNLRIPYTIGYVGGVFFDLLSRLTNYRFSVSAIRIKKFCSNTQFTSSFLRGVAFMPPYTLEEGIKSTIKYEFSKINKENEAVFYTE